MKPSYQNFTIIVNWKSKGFGCAKTCTYCNWRDSSLLPHGSQSTEAISAFISQCRKSFVTISGGADPLYKFEDHSGELLAMIRVIQAHGFKVRIITREVQHVAKLKDIADFISISLDADVLNEIKRHRHDWDGMQIEYSLVLPPVPTSDIAATKAQYAALRSTLGQRLVLRENLNSVFPLDLEALSFGHSGIVLVPKSLCLNARYLSTIDCTGHEIVQDNAALANHLMSKRDVVLFGGFVKHLISPVQHMDYSDIDVIALSSNVIDTLAARFAFTFEAVSSADSYPRYFIGKSARAGKTVQVVLMHSMEDAKRFIFNAQYDVDRVGYSNHAFIFDLGIGETTIRHAIEAKQASTIQSSRSLALFSNHRPHIENRHKLKLVRKGFSIIEPIHAN